MIPFCNIGAFLTHPASVVGLAAALIAAAIAVTIVALKKNLGR